AGSADITYTASNGCGSSFSVQTVTVTVARTISTTGASFGPFCNTAGNNITVAYITTGSFSTPFKVQLSNSAGTFASDSTTNIIGIGFSSPISATIPAATTAGSGYRVRVINGSPSIIFGSDNGSNISIVAPVSIGSITGTPSVLTSASVTLSCTPGGGTWSSSNSTIASVNSGTGSVTGVTEGTCTISYTATNTCGSATATQSFLVTNSVLYIAPSATAWLTASNWLPGTVPTATQRAVISGNPTAANGAIGINMSGGAVAVGAIYDSARSLTSLTIGNSSPTSGTLTLNGATVNGTSNVVLANISSTTTTLFTIQNFQGTNSGQTMDLILGSSAKNIITGVGSSSTVAGNTINILSKLTGSAPITFLGGGTWNGSTGNAGGILKLGNPANSNTGGITAGVADGTNSGILELDSTGVITNTGGNDVTINNNSELFLNAPTSTTFTQTNTVLNLNGNGNNASITTTAGAIVSASSRAFTWNGPINVNSDAKFSVLGSGTLTVSGNISGTGKLIKVGSTNGGNLTLTGSSNSWSGGTEIGTGNIVINSASSLPGGSLTMTGLLTGLGSGLILNNSAQTITSLSSSFVATSGTQAQVISLPSASTVLTINQSANTTFGSNGTVATQTAIISGSGSVVKSGSGSLTLKGLNLFTGGLTINNGEVVLNPPTGASSTWTNPFILNGGVLSTVGITSYTYTLGTLKVDNNAIINLDTVTSHSLKFDPSNAVGWTAGKVLTITNWKGAVPYAGTAGFKGKIFAGADATGLTASQLAQIQFVDSTGQVFGAVIRSSGEIVPKVASITTTASAYGTPYCVGSAPVISVAFTPTGIMASNFKVQLSDASGNFPSAPDTTTNIIGTGSASPINATIPGATPVGAGYRVRVLNGNPRIYGSNNGTNIVLVNAPAPGAISGNSVSIGGTVALTSSPAGGTWSSSNSSIASINASTGLTYGVSVGTCTISYGVTNVCGTVYSTVSFSVANHPVIDSFSPAYGKPGDTITISGQYFNSSSANNIVYFGATKASIISGSATSLSVIVDTSATYGPLSILNAGNQLSGMSAASFLPTYYSEYFITDSINFKPKVDFTVGTAPNIAAVGDLDGDGKPEFISANTQSGAGTTLTIYKNVSTPGVLNSSSFASVGTLTTNAGPTNVKVSDIDGDGKLDVISVNTANPSISVFRNTSSGPGSYTFASVYNKTTVQSGVLGAQPVVSAIADYDDDGRPDVAVSSSYATSDRISVLRNTSSVGSLSFANPVTFPSATTPIGICAGDFDGDGLPDIAVACSTSNVVSIFRNLSSVGSLNFATAIDSNTGSAAGSSPVDIATGDIDGDGKTDLIVTNPSLSSTSFSVLRNTGTSGAISFAAHFDFATGFGPVGIGLGDINGDKKLDVVITNTGVNTVSVFRNTATSGSISSGSFAATVDMATGSAPTGINICDMDGDRYPDLIVANKGTNTISLIRNYPLPYIAPITGNTPICAGGGTVTVSSATLGGWWSLSNSRATINTVTGLVTGVTAGIDTIFYSYTIGGDTNSVTAPITIRPLPVVAAIGGPSSVCPGDSITLTNDTTGGVWSVTNTSLATISGIGRVRGINPGLDTVLYTVTSLGCSTTVIKPVTINTSPFAGVISGTTSLCVSTSVSLTSSGDFGGSWATNNSSIASVNAATGQLTGVAAGSTTITYSVTNSCRTVFDTIIVTISPLADPGTITGLSQVCNGSSTTLSNAVVGGTWSSSNTALATVSAGGVVTGVAPGVAIISYTVSNVCGPQSDTMLFTVNTVPAAPPAITGIRSICFGGGTTTLSDAVSGGRWSSGSVGIATVDSITGVVTGVTPGTATITYTVFNSCGSNNVTTTVTVHGSPTASILSAVLPCVGYATTITYAGTTGDTIRYQVDGGSDIPGVISGGTFSFSTGVITIPHTYRLRSVSNAGCTSILNIDTTITPRIMLWVGGTSGVETNWSTAANWSCGSIPILTDDVTIPTGRTYYPVVAAGENVSVRNLIIQGGASLTVDSAAILNVKGDLRNSSTVYGLGFLKMNNTTAQSIRGLGRVSNLEINNTAGASLDTASRLTIARKLTITSGTLTTNDSVVLASDSSYTARITPISPGGVITGNVKTVQYIPGGRRCYRFIGHPFSTYIALSQLQNYIDITGTGGATNGFTPTATNAPSAIRYNPLVANSSLPSDPGWRPFTSVYATADSNRFHRYQGFRLFFRGAKGEGLGYGAYTPSPVTIAMWGPVNQGSQTVPMVKGASSLRDYNMISNPYPSPTDIGTVITNAKISGNVAGAAFFVWNPYLGAAGQYQSITINTTTPEPYIIQAYTSFYVRATNNNDSLNFTESNKSESPTAASLLKIQSETTSLVVYDKNYHPWDLLTMNFNSQATDNEDNDYDAVKPSGAEFNFYSMSADNKQLAIDGRPYDAGKTISLGVSSGYAQEFIIKAENVSVPQNGKLYLHDKLLKQYVLLQQGTEYRFEITKDKVTQGDNRFELTMEPAEVKTTQAARNLKVTLLPNPATTEVKIGFSSAFKSEVFINITDLSGVNIYTKELGAMKDGAVIVPLNKLASGIYMVEVTSGSEKSIQRLIKE
ncbi:MAG: VCBS repeat-containing protein, partial [Taibaiella sp.]|nr:VCBS repeat-containing protein [Taibaiella sp.]